MLAVIGPDANSLAAEGEDGIVLIDGGSSSWSDGLLALVDDVFAPKPITALFNTHWHPEHTGSNVTLGGRGVQIVAHENTKLWLGTEVRVRWSGKKYAPLAAPGIPRHTFLDSDSMEIAGRTLEHRYLLNAHTDGDICVFFPDDNVLVTGGAVSNDGWPIIDWWTGGWIGGMLDAYDVMLGIADENTRIVPSRGPLMSIAELRSQQEMFLTIFDRLQSMLRKSFGTDEILASRPTAEFDAQWGDPEQFVTLAFQSMWGHLRDVYDTRLRTIP
jgi:glyoxylase-like metal-dependent hydrolase (beta-lactamase superfamily II)